MNELKGIHHITAITSSAEKIYDFFTSVLSLRLVKKTVNQDLSKPIISFLQMIKAVPEPI